MRLAHLALALLLLAAPAWAGQARKGSATITGATLSPNTFLQGCTDSTVVGALGVTMKANATFTGTLVVGGTDGSKFKLSSASLPSNLECNGTQSGCGSGCAITITPTQTGAVNSGHHYALTVTGQSATTILTPTLSGNTYPAASPTATVIGTLGATLNTGASFIDSGGTFSIASGTCCQISGASLETLNTPDCTAGCAVTINAVLAGASNTPLAQAFTVTETSPTPPPMTATLTIAGQSDLTYTGLHISTTTGPCIAISGSANITIQASQIGPCGTDGTTSASQGITITSNSSVNIYDSYIHVENKSSNCSPASTHDNIYILNNGTAAVNIQGNVLAYGQDNIHVYNAANVSVTGNFMLNPRGSTACANADNLQGNQFQAWADDATPNATLTVSNNYTISAPTGYLYAGAGSDEISFGVTNGITAASNYIIGAQNAFACGLILDYKANTGTLTSNVIGNGSTGAMNCGLGISSGTNHTVTGNKVLITSGFPYSAGLGANGGYSPVACGTISLTSNQAYAQQSSGWVQGYYNNGYCTSVTLTTNTFDVGCTAGSNCAAYAALNPLSTTNPPPLIPPLPKTCVVHSPYSTQAGSPPCAP